MAGVFISIERAPIESSDVCACAWRAGLVARAAGSGKIRDVVNTCSDTIRVWDIIFQSKKELTVVAINLKIKSVAVGKKVYSRNKQTHTSRRVWFVGCSLV